MQRPPVDPIRQIGISLGRSLEGALPVDGEKGVDLGLRASGAFEHALQEADGADLTGPKHAPGLSHSGIWAHSPSMAGGTTK